MKRTLDQQIADLEELIALQRFWGRHGFLGSTPADITKLRKTREQYGYLSETNTWLLDQAIKEYKSCTEAWRGAKPEDMIVFRRTLREKGVHNVPRLLDLYRRRDS